MSLYLPYLIPLGLALFVLRTQLLRVALEQANGDVSLIHKSPSLGAMSGWASLLGAVVLIGCAIALDGWLKGILTIVIGLGIGIIGSAIFLPTVGSTLAMGHHGGEGHKSIAELNRRFGHVVAFAVGWIAFMCVYIISSIRL
jgi:hypothetical protein